jgi:CBS domain containing-hemolysin-like protein
LENLLFPAAVFLLILFIGGAFFSGVETALVAISRHKLKAIQEEHPEKAAAIESWLENPNRMLTTMLIGINVVGILSAIITENIVDFLIQKYGWPKFVGPIISFGFVALVVIEFCEIIPKILAYHHAERYTLMLIRPLNFIDRIFSPVGKGMVWLGNLIIRMFGGKPGSPQGAYITEAELLGMVDSGEEQGVLDKEEGEMIRSIIEFGETQVREIMTPRPDMHCVAADATVARVAQFIEEVKHSRIPVFEGSEENIVGVIYSKALLKALKEGRDNEPVRDFLHTADFVPETKMIDTLLHMFQKHHKHIAIVVDEYGSTAGLVTLEDVLEEIVGEIRDEYDTEEPLYRWLDSDTLRADARIDIAELNDALGSDFPDEGDYDTLAGLILNDLGKVPKTGDRLAVDGYEMSVEKMAGRRIASVIIRKPAPPQPPDEEDNKEEP